MTAVAIENIRFDDVRSKRILAALSGGADSVALLVLLLRKRDEYGLSVCAAHLHHGIRGAQADADAAFCRELCASLGVELIEGRVNALQIAADEKLGLETAARNARYAFLRDAQQKCGADVIALAHHMDDQAETVLMHLLRGTGPEGICGMARLQDGLYRPLLEIPKQALVQFLEKERISWREDATNRISDTPRNALRLNVLPEIEKSYPLAAAALARHARLARVENDYMARACKHFLEERLQQGPYGQRLLIRGCEEEALLRRAFRKIVGASLEAQACDSLVALARKPRGAMEISGKLRAEKTPDALYFLPRGLQITAETMLTIPGETLLPGVCRILAEEGDFPMERDNPFTELFDQDALQGACLRTRREGDRIHPLGAPGEKLLSDYMTDKKIDRPLREVIPLVAKGKHIIWAGGVGISHSARIQRETQRIVRLTIKPIMDEKPEVSS